VGYLSPEQLMGGDIDARSDLFSVGVMLWELLTGRSLFPGDHSEAVLAQVVRYARHMSRLEAPHAINPEVPRPVSSLTAALLAVERDQRPRDAAAALEWLRSSTGVGAGSDELAEVLATRFPDRAPVRSSVSTESPAISTEVRARMQAVTATVPGAVPPLAPPAKPVESAPVESWIEGRRGIVVGIAIAAVAAAAAVLIWLLG